MTESSNCILSNQHQSFRTYIGQEYHPSEQSHCNPSQSVRTRCQLETDGKMCMFALTLSRTEPKNIKEAMADSVWIESMQEEIHQFDRLDDSPQCPSVEAEYVSLSACLRTSDTNAAIATLVADLVPTFLGIPTPSDVLISLHK
ncbi:hypothetical protein Tco_0364275 [Tanacetum coccineum]